MVTKNPTEIKTNYKKNVGLELSLCSKILPGGA